MNLRTNTDDIQMGETANNVIGSTVNPFDRNLSAGGACGGETFRSLFTILLITETILVDRRRRIDCIEGFSPWLGD